MDDVLIQERLRQAFGCVGGPLAGFRWLTHQDEKRVKFLWADRGFEGKAQEVPPVEKLEKLRDEQGRRVLLHHALQGQWRVIVPVDGNGPIVRGDRDHIRQFGPVPHEQDKFRVQVRETFLSLRMSRGVITGSEHGLDQGERKSHQGGVGLAPWCFG